MAVAMLLSGLWAGAFPPRLDGTMMPYDFSRTDSVVPWDSAFRPVFISYVARHGARFLSSEKKVGDIESVLTKARADGLLTAKGESFLRLLGKVREVTDGRWGALDATGIMEEARLGDEMAATCPSLLEKGKVRAMATYVPRVVMTMYEVCHSLARHSSHLEISTSEGRQFDSMLRFFHTDANYEAYIDSGPWRFAFDKFERDVTPIAPAASMIKGVTDSRRLQKLTSDAYSVLQSLRAAGIEADPSVWFTQEEYEKCWEVANLRHYYQRSPSSFSAIPAYAAAPLLKDIVLSIDSVFERRKELRMAETIGQPVDTVGDLRAELRFGHAETVLPLFAAMKLPGCSAPLCDPADVADVWKDWEIAPLGANLMIVCLEKHGGRPYVSLRLNGRWIEMEGSKVIPWSRLSKLWRE